MEVEQEAVTGERAQTVSREMHACEEQSAVCNRLPDVYPVPSAFTNPALICKEPSNLSAVKTGAV